MLFIDELEQFNLFLKENALYLALAGVGLILIAIAIIFFSGKTKPGMENFETLFNALGGKENVRSAESRGSRLSLILVDESKIVVEALPKDLVANYIKMTGKLILVVGNKAEKIAAIVNKKAG